MSRKTLGMLALIALVVTLTTFGFVTRTTAASNYLDDASAELALLGGGDIAWQEVEGGGFCIAALCDPGQGLCCARNALGICICACRLTGGQFICNTCTICPP